MKREALKETTNFSSGDSEITELVYLIKQCQEKSKKLTFSRTIPDVDYCQRQPRVVIPVIENLPRAYKDCSFDNFYGNDKLIGYLKSVSSPDNLGFLISGPSGCGKTHLAVALAKHLAIPGEFINAAELLLIIRSSFRENSESTEKQIFDRYTGSMLLILDDMGSEKTSEHSITTLYTILEKRLSECRPTIITTNLNYARINSVFGERIASRIALLEMIRIDMPDYRKKHAMLKAKRTGNHAETAGPET